jgi:hypothetical protein
MRLTYIQSLYLLVVQMPRLGHQVMSDRETRQQPVGIYNVGAGRCINRAGLGPSPVRLYGGHTPGASGSFSHRGDLRFFGSTVLQSRRPDAHKKMNKIQPKVSPELATWGTGELP